MNPFIHYQIALTPLSPMHIGCGEEYTPTNYIIDEQLFFRFNPEQLPLTASQRNKLLNLSSSDEISLLSYQLFFKSIADIIKPKAVKIRAVVPALAEQYEDAIGKLTNTQSGDNALNRLAIERTITNPYTYDPIIPGSSLKGCIRTAVADAKSYRDGRDAKRSLDRQFSLLAKDPFRLIKIADLQSAQGNISAQIAYCVNRKKEVAYSKDGEKLIGKENLAKFIEQIALAQYRAFQGQISLQTIDNETARRGKDVPEERPTDLTLWAKAVNAYHLPRLKKIIATLEKLRYEDRKWVNAIAKLLAGIDTELQQGSIMLVNLGKYGGAENKTLTDYAQINIKTKHGYITDSESTTYWLSAASKKTTQDLLPFGWALIEINPSSDNQAIQTFCAEWQEMQHAEQQKIQAIIAKNQAALKAAEEAQKLEAQKQAEKAKQQAEEAAAAIAKEKELASLNENQAAVLLCFDALDASASIEASDDKFNHFYKDICDFYAKASAWNAEDKAYLKEKFNASFIYTKLKFSKSKKGKQKKADLQNLMAQLS